MHNFARIDQNRGVLPPQVEDPEAAYNEGVAAGCSGCFSALVLAVLGFVVGYSFVGISHEYEWLYTQEEFENRHGLSDAGLAAFGNCMMGGLVGAILLPVAGAALRGLLRSKKTRDL